jgi:hypothetical protein
MHINIRSIQHNLHLLNSYFVTNKFEPDILMVSETWSNNNNVNLYIPDNFMLISNFFRNNYIRGGVSIFAKKNMF